MAKLSRARPFWSYRGYARNVLTKPSYYTTFDDIEVKCTPSKGLWPKMEFSNQGEEHSPLVEQTSKRGEKHYVELW